MDVPLNAKEAEHVAAQIRSGRAAGEGEVLRDALRLRMDRDAGGHEKSHEARREELRRSIETGYREANAAGRTDREEFMEPPRLEIESRGSPGP